MVEVIYAEPGVLVFHMNYLKLVRLMIGIVKLNLMLNQDMFRFVDIDW